MGSLWGRFGVTLSLLGGTWEALGVHWELVGTSLGMFWGLKVLFGGLWRDLGRALGLTNREHSYLRVKRRPRRPKNKRGEGAGKVQGGGEYGSKGKWKSASAPRDHQEEEIKEDFSLSDTL